MASIEESLYYRLSNYAGLTALVSTRIYPLNVPQNADLPYVSFTKISKIKPHAFGIDSTCAETRFQIDVFSSTITSAVAIAVQIRGALSRYRATVESVIIQDIFFENEQIIYEEDTEIYHIALDFIIYYTES